MSFQCFHFATQRPDAAKSHLSAMARPSASEISASHRRYGRKGSKASPERLRRIFSAKTGP